MRYTDDEKKEILNKVFTYIAEDRLSLTKALEKVKMHYSTFYDWLDLDEKECKRYARACEIRNDKKFESIEEDYNETPRLTDEGKIDSAWVALQRLKIDSKKWELSKLQPKKYGDKLDLTTNGEAVKSIPIILSDGRTYEDLKNDLKPE